MKNPKPSIKSSYDVIVVGSGIAGVSTALAAAESGLSVALLEKDEMLGGGTGCEVRTEGEFDAAITRALADTSGMNIIRVHIGIDDRSPTLDRLAAAPVFYSPLGSAADTAMNAALWALYA